MPTMAQAIRAYVQSIDEKVTSDQIKEAITTQYPDQWKSTTLQAHLYACVVNNPKAYIHHPFTQKFLYRHSDGSFEIYDENVRKRSINHTYVIEVSKIAGSTFWGRSFFKSDSVSARGS
jgi:hypothetical protein